MTDISVGLSRLVPPMVLVTSPKGIHDVLARSDAFVGKTTPHEEMRALVGENCSTPPMRIGFPAGGRRLDPGDCDQHFGAGTELCGESIP